MIKYTKDKFMKKLKFYYYCCLFLLFPAISFATDITWSDFTSGNLVTLSNLNEIKSAVNTKLDKYTAAVAFSAADATPDISGTSDTFRHIFKTADTTIYTDFDDGTDHTTINDGQLLIILAQHAAGLDCTSSQINCNGGSDYTFTVGDVAICYFDDTADGDGQWLCSVSNPVGSGFSESGDYSPTGTWDWSGVNGATTWPTFNQNTTGTAAGLSGDLDPDQLSGDDGDNDKVDGEILYPSDSYSVIISDSGDGNPATGAVTISATQMLYSVVVDCQDSDGCNLTVSETNAIDSMVVHIFSNLSSAGEISFADSSGVQDVREITTLGVGENISFEYRTNMWQEIGHSVTPKYDITLGDTSVSISDAGTGYVTITVDGEVQKNIYDGYSEAITGFINRLITTTAGHYRSEQVYDANGSTWRDAIKFINGDSSDSDPNNRPRVEFGSNVTITGLGNMAVGMVWGSEITTNTVLTYTGINQMYLVSAAVTVTLPDVGTASDDAWYGDFVQFQVQDSSETLTIDCDAADKINRQGTAQAAGVTVTTPGTAGDVVTCIATTNADGSGTDGWMCRANVTLAQGS